MAAIGLVMLVAPIVFQVRTLRIRRELSVAAPAGSRHKGFEDIIVQDLMVKAETTRYRRERWETPDGKGLIAPLPAGIVGGCGPHLIRLVLMLHFQGQMTCERIVALLTGLGLMISKRQVVRLLTAKLEDFRAEDEVVLRAGLRSAPFVTVDCNTGARHAGKSCFTTHIGSHRFTAFRTGPGKSRLAFLGRLLGGAARYVINAAAIASMRGADLPQDIIANLAGHSSLAFDSHEQWMNDLRALGIADLEGDARSGAGDQRSGAHGGDRSRGLARTSRHHLRRRRPISRRRLCAVLGSRRAPRS